MDEESRTHRRWAREMKEMFSIPFLTPDQIQELWESHSDSLAAGWMNHSGENRDYVLKVLMQELRRLICK